MELKPNNEINGSPKVGSNKVYILLFIFIVLTSITTYVLYAKTQELFRWSLNERLSSIASVAATHFEPEQLDQIRGKDSVRTTLYKETILDLQSIRENTKNLTFIYILRKTDDPDVLEFVADADSLNPEQLTDLNGDGVLDESDELTYPGDPYDIKEFPDFKNSAFSKPFVDPELIQDQWGTFLSGTAPVWSKNSKTSTKYVLGVDLDVSEFHILTNLALIPFVLFVIFLLFVLTTLTLILKRMWKKQVELLAELDDQKDAVLHMVAHQFKGPVTTINFLTELLLDGSFGELNKDQKESVTNIRSASKKMGSESEMILDAAKVTLGKLPLEPAPVDLNEVIKDVVLEADNHAKEKKVHLNVSLPKEKLPAVVLDRKYTQLALDNLLSNAIKYAALKSEEGNVDFTVQLKGNTLFCRVKDTGIGIPKKDQANIFKELFRASNAGKDGNGLGLHITKGAIEAQGGKLWFESEEGKGTTFYAELPLRKVSVT